MESEKVQNPYLMKLLLSIAALLAALAAVVLLLPKLTVGDTVFNVLRILALGGCATLVSRNFIGFLRERKGSSAFTANSSTVTWLTVLILFVLLMLATILETKVLNGNVQQNYEAPVFTEGQRWPFPEAAVGGTVGFGAIDQDYKNINGKEDIEWLVLAKENGRILVISRYALDSRTWTEEGEEAAWETCALRTWLNGTFLETAFAPEEQARIASATGEDQVFLLSTEECEAYLPTDEARLCSPTPYALARECAVDESTGNAGWWLRTPGSDPGCIAYVTQSGQLHGAGFEAGSEGLVVRPALWIDLTP